MEYHLNLCDNCLVSAMASVRVEVMKSNLCEVGRGTH